MAEINPNPPRNDFRELCYHIGLALVTWQRVEEIHFMIFCGFLGIPQSQIASAAYHSTESFAGRNTMLDRMAQYFLKPIPELQPQDKLRKYKELRGQWQELHKLLKDNNDNRNKLAHYTVDIDIIHKGTDDEGNIVLDVTPHTLRPSTSNFVSRLQGRTKDDPKHNLGVPELKQYAVDFRQAEREAYIFLTEVWMLPAPHELVAERPMDLTGEQPPSQSKSQPTDDSPSGS